MNNMKMKTDIYFFLFNEFKLSHMSRYFIELKHVNTSYITRRFLLLFHSRLM